MNIENFFPNIPDKLVVPFLTDHQKKVWQRIPKNQSVFFGFSFGGMVMDNDPLDDPELVEARQEAEAKEKQKEQQAAANGRGLPKGWSMMADPVDRSSSRDARRCDRCRSSWPGVPYCRRRAGSKPVAGPASRGGSAARRRRPHQMRMRKTRPRRRGAADRQPVFVMNDDQFDQWVFGGPQECRAGRNKLDSLLTLQVDEVVRTCGLSEMQKKKLLLAGQGDIKRFFDRVEEKRKKFDKVKNDQNKVGEIYPGASAPPDGAQLGAVQRGSIFAKTLKKVSATSRPARYEEMVREKRQFRYRAKVELVVACSTRRVGFSDDQRRAARRVDPPRDRAPHEVRPVRLLAA